MNGPRALLCGQLLRLLMLPSRAELLLVDFLKYDLNEFISFVYLLKQQPSDVAFPLLCLPLPPFHNNWLTGLIQYNLIDVFARQRL